MNNMCARSL